MLHMILVRSPYAHAEIKSIRPDAARAMPGVVAILTGTDLTNELRPLPLGKAYATSSKYLNML